MKKVMEKMEWLLELGGTKRDITFLILSGIALIISIFKMIPGLPFDAAWVAIVLCGVPIIMEAVIGLITEFDIKADVLVSLALIASVLIGEDFAAGEVAFIMQIGGLLEELTVAKARAGIEKLVHLAPQTVRVLAADKDSEWTEGTVIPAQEVAVGNILRVLPGETIPVDGVILSGQTSVNQAVMTGESMPVDKNPGDEVSSGTVNQFGAFEMEATRVGEDSSIQRMIRLVQSADAGKAKIVGMAAIGNATKHGFLVREGDALERLAKVSKITFDKTGTLTYGTPVVVACKSADDAISDTKLYRYVASAERNSEHPLGKAVVACYRKEQDENLLEAEEFAMLPGQGIEAVLEGKKVLAGNEKLLENQNVVVSTNRKEEMQHFLGKGCTVILVAVDGIFAGYLALSDTVREESISMIQDLQTLKVTPVLLTGDNENAASAIAAELGISQVRAACLPEDKLNYIAEYQKNGEAVCMIGDGINDAPALKKADVGVAMGGVGSDIAVDAADIALVDDEVKELPHLIALSKKMMRTITLNLSFSMGLNFLAIFLAITGILNPVAGALVHNCGSVLVVINSALLLKWRRK